MRFLAPALFVALLAAPAIAQDHPIDHRIAPAAVEAPKAAAVVSKRYRRAKVSRPGGAFLVSIQCGRGRIMVARTASVQIEGFCRDLYAEYKFKVAGGWASSRPATCHEANRHRCGSGVDISQWGRSRGPGHLLPADFPVALSERLADKWGLFPGSRWHRNPDVGHFQTKGSLYGSNWPASKLEQFAVAAAAKKIPDDPEPKHPLLGATQEVSAVMKLASAEPEVVTKDQERHPQGMGDDLLARFKPKADAALFYIFSEVPLGPKDRPVAALVASMQSLPLGSPREEVVRAARLFEKSEKMMLAFAEIESSLNCKNKTGSYKGLFQLSDTEFRKYGYGDIWDCRDNAIAAANKFATEGEMFKRAYGRTASFSDHYLIHQQGWRGAEEHVDSPNELAWKNMCKTGEGRQKGVKWCKLAIWGNVPPYFKRLIKGGVDALTSNEFVTYWRSKVDTLVAGIGSYTVGKAYAQKFVKKKRYAYHKKKRRYAKLASR